ncbi:protein of unknown function [Cupriavidus taiwanensis]|nr:protein of unknown function [Cupriavidus taiwanensis]
MPLDPASRAIGNTARFLIRGFSPIPLQTLSRLNRSGAIVEHSSVSRNYRKRRPYRIPARPGHASPEKPDRADPGSVADPPTRLQPGWRISERRIGGPP